LLLSVKDPADLSISQYGALMAISILIRKKIETCPYFHVCLSWNRPEHDICGILCQDMGNFPK
jgi:hypothetical protein